MIRKLINDAPMSPKERRAKSNADKIARGERLLHTWLIPEAAQALDNITGPEGSRGAIAQAVNEALIAYARRKRV
jgi:DNA-binding TFAR19-related protein (PDSD5 family)